MKIREFVIRVRYGGLGDHLLWSHLPRIAKTAGGFQKVYISNRSEYRQPDYKKLIWELNPFVDGFCDSDAECPAIPTIMPGANCLDMMMLAFGLDDGSRFHEPEIFYSPKIITQLQDKHIFDPNYVSHAGAISNRKLIRYLDESGPVDLQMRARSKSYGLRRDVPVLNSEGVFNYCDVIASCRRFYCLTSGGATLAAALRKPSTVFYGYGVNRWFHHSPQHKYVDVSMTCAKLIRPAIRIFDKVR